MLTLIMPSSEKNSKWLVIYKRKSSTKKRGIITKKDDHTVIFFLWSWRGLNPRPNEEAKCFLHAYPCLRFSSDYQDQGHQTVSLSSTISFALRSQSKPVPIFSTSISNSLGTMAFGRCLVLTPCAKIKQIYYYSIKQQEQSYYCQL